MEHDVFMKMAILEAHKALEAGEVPIGAVIVCNNRPIAKAHNQVERLKDVTAHAEIIAITAAENTIGAKYLKNCSIYVSLEPCVMCAGALALTQIPNIIYGAEDPKKGYSFFNKNIIPKKVNVVKGVLEKECSMLIRNFFADKR